MGKVMAVALAAAAVVVEEAAVAAEWVAAVAEEAAVVVEWAAVQAVVLQAAPAKCQNLLIFGRSII
jgi:hypothetical protein